MKHIWYHDNEVALNTLSQGAMQGYPQIGQGTTVQTRVGNEINVTGFHVKGFLNNNSGSESWARLIIMAHNGNIDPNTIGTFPMFMASAIDNIATVSSVNGMDAMYYPLNRNDITVYKDKVYKLGGSTSNSAGSCVKYFNHFVKFPGRGMRIKFHGNNYGVNQQSKFISVMWIVADANDDTTTGTTVELSQMTRLWFTDA